MNLKKLFKKVFGKLFCSCRVQELVTYVGKSFNDDGSIDAILKCRKCGKYQKGTYVPYDVIKGIYLAENDKLDVYFESAYTASVKKRVSVVVLIKNIRNGIWYISDKAIRQSLFFALSSRGTDRSVAAKEGYNTSNAGVLHFSSFAVSLEKLLGGHVVGLSLSDGKIFLNMLSSYYGYDNARKRWQWERDGQSGTMTFKERIKRI